MGNHLKYVHGPQNAEHDAVFQHIFLVLLFLTGVLLEEGALCQYLSCNLFLFRVCLCVCFIVFRRASSGMCFRVVFFRGAPSHVSFGL